MPRTILYAAAALSLSLLSGCATQGDFVSLQRDLDEVKTRLLKNERETGAERLATREGVDKSVKGVQRELESMRKVDADLLATLEALRVDLQVAAGRIDDATVAARKPLEDVALLKEDSDRKIASMGDRLQKLAKELEDLKKVAEEARQREAEKTPELLYQNALDAFKAGEMKKAREKFSRFVSDFPAHDLSANAHYWIGETFYQEKEFEQAILEFQEVVKNFPGKEKVPAAMLKQAMAFSELGDLKSAKYLFKKVSEDFPEGEEAKRAKERLKEIK